MKQSLPQPQVFNTLRLLKMDEIWRIRSNLFCIS